MNRGFTLMELVLTVIVLSILSAFTFSVIWQYSKLYSDTRGGYVYGEAAAVMERMSRELRDANVVDPTPFPSDGSVSTYISFVIQNGTPADKTSLTAPYWVQYCLCTAPGRLYRVAAASQPAGNACGSCPPAGSVLMSRNISSSGFQVKYVRNDASTVDDDSYEITLKLSSGGSSDTSITLVTCVSPRNYPVAGRSFSGGYYDEIN